MPSLWSRRRNRSMEAAEARARMRQRKLDSWNEMKAAIAAKYQKEGV